MKSVRSFPLLISALLLSGCAHPPVISSYASLRAALVPGDHVVVTASAAPVPGVVEAVSGNSLTITSDHARREFPRETIARVEKLERPWRRTTLTGLAIGGGTGAAIAGFSDCRAGETSCGGTRASGIAGSALVGVGIGAAAGAKLRATLIYVAPGRDPSRGD